MTLFAIQFAIFAGFVNMMKMVYLSASPRERLRNLMMVSDIAMNLSVIYMKNSYDVNFEVIYHYQQDFSETYLSVKTDYNRLLR